MNRHEQLKENALQDINILFGDTSVPPETTLDSLRELRSEVQGLIEAIESDLKP